MNNEQRLRVFGPVPSRRLGKSMGVNNIPPKICTYSCVYCQLGRTNNLQIKPVIFYKPKELARSVKHKVKTALEMAEPIDYLTFVPNGEPTLDTNLGEAVDRLTSLRIKIAVITNSSLLWNKEIRDALCKADWVSVKIDAISKNIWQKINRPHGLLRHKEILAGVTAFSDSFSGDLVSETMLVKNINDSNSELKKIAGFISNLNIHKSFISIPTRPPAEKWVQPPTEYHINRAYQIFEESDIEVEYLIDYEGNAFAYTETVEKDLLSITSVHPMREEAVREFLRKADSNWNIVQKLIAEKKLVEIKYNKNKFYIRKIPANFRAF